MNIQWLNYPKQCWNYSAKPVRCYLYLFMSWCLWVDSQWKKKESYTTLHMSGSSCPILWIKKNINICIFKRHKIHLRRFVFCCYTCILRQFTGQRFQCNECGNEYRYAANMDTHKRLAHKGKLKSYFLLWYLWWQQNMYMSALWDWYKSSSICWCPVGYVREKKTLSAQAGKRAT